MCKRLKANNISWVGGSSGVSGGLRSRNLFNATSLRRQCCLQGRCPLRQAHRARWAQLAATAFRRPHSPGPLTPSSGTQGSLVVFAAGPSQRASAPAMLLGRGRGCFCCSPVLLRRSAQQQRSFRCLCNFLLDLQLSLQSLLRSTKVFKKGDTLILAIQFLSALCSNEDHGREVHHLIGST